MTSAVPPLQRNLAGLKKSLGFKSARSFFHEYLQRRTRLDFNYSYYMKIEGGNITPSPQVISNICNALEKDAAESLMLAYCEMIFPEKASMFKKLSKPPLVKKKATPAEDTSASTHQKFLTPAQVATISKSKNHYFAFLVLTLARSPITATQLGSSLPKSNFDLNTLLKDLEKMKLIHIEKDEIRSISNDMRFPEPEGASQKKLHDQIDLWNLGFHQEMNFDSLLQKMLIRRVSSRYLSVIQSHCGVLLDLVRASDEMDSSQNDDVLMLNISIQKGTLPG